MLKRYNIYGDLMVVYIDQVIASNVIVNYFFIKLIQVIFNEKVKIFRLIIGLIVSVLSMVLFLIPFRYIYNIRYFIGILVGFIIFYKKNIKTCIVEIALYYIVNICFVGTLVIFKVNNIILLFLSMLFTIVLIIISNYKDKVIKDKSLEYNVKINNLKLVGFLDTGNQTYCDFIPVVFVNSKYYSEEFTYYKKIMVNTINKEQQVDIYKGPLLKLNKKDYVVYYSFIKSLDKDIILNQELGDEND